MTADRKELESALAKAKADYDNAVANLDATNIRLGALSARRQAEDALAAGIGGEAGMRTLEFERRRHSEDRRKAVSVWARAVEDRRKALADRRNPAADLARAEADLLKADADLKRATEVLEELERALGK